MRSPRGRVKARHIRSMHCDQSSKCLGKTNRFHTLGATVEVMLQDKQEPYIGSNHGIAYAGQISSIHWEHG